MPVLEYGPLLASGGLYRAQYAVRAVMAWPKLADEPSRNEYLATLMSKHLADINAIRKKLPDPIAADGWFATILAIRQHESAVAAFDEFQSQFDEAGGHTAVSMAPGLRAFQKDFTRRVGDWFAAGLILALVRRMEAHHSDLPGGASVNKAIFILEKVSIPLVPRNSLYLRQAWKTYKPVAHFCAALFDWFFTAYEGGGKLPEIGARMDRELNENFMMFLSEAEAYLEFGLNYHPPHAKAQLLLNPAETWILPEYRPWSESPFKPAPLSGAQLEAALHYKAAIPAG